MGLSEDDNVDAQILTAQAMVAAHLKTVSILDRPKSEKHIIPYDLGADEVIVTRDGPIASMTSALIGGIDIALDSAGEHEDLIINPWSVGYLQGVSANSEAVLGFRAGWTPENVPDDVKSAIALTAGMVFLRPDITKISERIGDYSYTTEQAAGGGEGTQYDYGGLNARVCGLLSRYKKPFMS